MGDWMKLRQDAVMVAEEALARRLDAVEREMVLFPRTCQLDSCHLATGPLEDCTSCHGVTYCSPLHQQEDTIGHAAACRQLLLSRLLDHREATLGLSFSVDPSVDSTYLGTGPDIFDFVGQPEAGGQEVPVEELEWTFLTNQMSGVLTLLDQASRLVPGLGELEELVVHVAGATTIAELLGMVKWEYLAHRLPALTSLTYVFVGPQLEPGDDGEEPWLPCDSCMERGRRVEFRFFRGPYGDYLATSPEPPHIVLVQNCGFSEFEASPGSPGWTSGWSGLPSLLHSSVPLVFTSYTLGEAEGDLARLLDTVDGEVEVLVSCQENVMRSQRPVRDWAREEGRDVFYSNQYVSVVRKSL